MILSEWLGGVRQHVQEDTYGWVACVSVCHSMNTLYLLVEETEIVSTSVKVLRLCVNTLQHSLNVSLEEHIRRILGARLNEKARLVCKGWHDERKRHWCSSVSFLFVSIRQLLKAGSPRFGYFLFRNQSSRLVFLNKSITVFSGLYCYRQ